MTCAHATTLVRERRDALGRAVFARQCERCLERVGDWLSHRDPATWKASRWIDSGASAADVPDGLAESRKTLRLVGAEAAAQDEVCEVARALLDGTGPRDALSFALQRLDVARERRRTA